jgi:hypothetical protein
VALAIEDPSRPGGGLVVLEVGGPRFTAMPLIERVHNSTAVAVGRVQSAYRPFAKAAAAWSLEHVGREQFYAWDDVVLAGFIAATRRFALPTDRDRLLAAVEAGVGELSERQRVRPEGLASGYSCASFVLAAFRAVDAPLQFDLGQPRAAGERPSLWELARGGERPLRSPLRAARLHAHQAGDAVRALVHGFLAGSTHQPALTSSSTGRDAWFRWATPGDIWRSATVVERHELVGLGGAVDGPPNGAVE